MRFPFGDVPGKGHPHGLSEVLKYRDEYLHASGYAFVDDLMKKLEVWRNASKP
jgi:hypothetical protein